MYQHYYSISIVRDIECKKKVSQSGRATMVDGRDRRYRIVQVKPSGPLGLREWPTPSHALFVLLYYVVATLI